MDACGYLMLMTKLPIIGKQLSRLWLGRALEVNPFAGHDGVWAQRQFATTMHIVCGGANQRLAEHDSQQSR